MASPYQGDSIFWVEVERIQPNPFQPRRTFDEAALASLSESIRQYGVLQPLTVTRKEIERPGEGIFVQYELIAGERRLRASKLAGLREVPVVIRSSEDSDRMKLELAIIENLQREDLNALDRAKAFKRLADEFSMQHKDIALKVGKSREYVSNTLRILMLPEVIQLALQAGDITEGHTRPLLMLADRPEEQLTLFREVVARRITVRDTEQLARRIAVERVRHKALLSPDLLDLEKKLSERLGTRVRIEKKDTGGKLLIDFFSPEDLTQLCLFLAQPSTQTAPAQASVAPIVPDAAPAPLTDAAGESAAPAEPLAAAQTPDQTKEKEKEENDLYSISNFSV
ncbi:ParB/RepB/Spo0J family partition protein [Candidatus Kaiserbacteria bacterium]|nr:ParB/RepB/Spo0J family partition protein [Candidatus Kaiserbacteria bacterium]